MGARQPRSPQLPTCSVLGSCPGKVERRCNSGWRPARLAPRGGPLVSRAEKGTFTFSPPWGAEGCCAEKENVPFSARPPAHSPHPLGVTRSVPSPTGDDPARCPGGRLLWGASLEGQASAGSGAALGTKASGQGRPGNGAGARPCPWAKGSLQAARGRGRRGNATARPRGTRQHHDGGRHGAAASTHQDSGRGRWATRQRASDVKVSCFDSGAEALILVGRRLPPRRVLCGSHKCGTVHLGPLLGRPPPLLSTVGDYTHPGVEARLTSEAVPVTILESVRSGGVASGCLRVQDDG